MSLQEQLLRVARVGAWTAAGAVSGGVAGLLLGLKDTDTHEPQTEEEARVAKVKNLLQSAERLGMLRQSMRPILSQLEQMLTHHEYRVKLELERQGYYPCSRCGNRHAGGGPDSTCLPMGSYWDEGGEEYVAPGDERWTPEGYRHATGEPWDGPTPSYEDDEEDEEPLH